MTPPDQIMGTVPGCLIPRLDTASAGYLIGGTSNCAIAEARIGRLSDHDLIDNNMPVLSSRTASSPPISCPR